jgi:hypothetical protein
MADSVKRAGLSFRQHWRRGFVRLGYLYYGFVVILLLWSLARSAFSLADTLPTPVTVGIDVAVVLALLLVLPPLASAFLPGPEDGAAEQGERLRPLVNDLAGRVGLDWGQHWVSRLDGLVSAGKYEEAAREYRERLGVSWDEAHQAVSDWSNNEPERKLRAILQHLQELRATTFPTTGG